MAIQRSLFRACLVAGLLLAGSASGAEPAALQRAIRLYESLDYEHAQTALREFLAQDPERESAGKAHLYLGLIAFNNNAPGAALAEFKLAVRANPAIELPPFSSPKAPLMLAEAREELAKELRPHEATAPAGAVSNAANEAPGHPRLPAILLGAAGVVAGGVAIYGAVQVAQYNSMISQLNQSKTGVGASVVSAHGSAQVWADAWIPLAVVSGGLFVSTVFTW